MSGRRLYDRWSRHLWALGRLYNIAFLGRGETFRRRSIEALKLTPGDRVLELGCGPGNSFERLRAAVGAEGSVTGVDYSTGMTRRAAERIQQAGWENVHVVRGDATTLAVPGETFDAVYASMSLSAMPDPEAAIRNAAGALHARGRLAVLDARPFQRFPLTILNPIVVPILKRLTNWDAETDIPGCIDASFESTSLREYNGGTIYIARGGNPSGSSVDLY